MAVETGFDCILATSDESKAQEGEAKHGCKREEPFYERWMHQQHRQRQYAQVRRPNAAAAAKANNKQTKKSTTGSADAMEISAEMWCRHVCELSVYISELCLVI